MVILHLLNVARIPHLTPEERKRNSHGSPLCLRRDESVCFDFSSKLPGVFPGIYNY